MGDGIGHVAVTGVAIGLLTGTSPTWTAVVVAVARRDADRGHPRARPHQRRRRAGAAVLRRPRRRHPADRSGRAEHGDAPAVPLRLHHHHLRRRRLGDDGAGRSSWCSSASGSRRSSSRSPRTRSSPRSPACAVRGYNLLVAVLAAVSVTVAMRTVGLLLVSRADGRAGGDGPAADPIVPHHPRCRDGPRHGRLGRRPGPLGVRPRRHDGRARPDDRAARAGRLRGHLAARGVAASPPAAGGAVRARRTSPSTR